MIPQIARRLISNYGSGKGVLFDPFCGTGTTLIEGLLAGYDVIGTDLNPLAVLISKVKCSTPDQIEIRTTLRKVKKRFEEDSTLPSCIPSFKNIDFWYYKPTVVTLASLKQAILEESSCGDARDFLLIAFSETARESSRTKLGEFKLVRRKENGNGELLPEVLRIFESKIERNIKGLSAFEYELQSLGKYNAASVYSFNTVDGVPESILEEGSVDVLVTSPPYGDSPTTVAYGQYSRLSSQWLGFDDAFQVDKKLMGGIKLDKLRSFDIPQLDAVIMRIASENENRAKVVAAFYNELETSCRNVAKTVRLFGHACYVVSNRRVMGITLPTDSVITTFFNRFGFREVEKHHREIPNKRMPSKNSPSNIAGVIDSTMTKETIIIMQKFSGYHSSK